MSILARKLATEIKESSPDQASRTDAEALFSHVVGFNRVVVGGEAYTIEDHLQDYGGVYMGTSREWLFADAGAEDLRALCELIVHKDLITLKLSHDRVSRAISVAAIN